MKKDVLFALGVLLVVVALAAGFQWWLSSVKKDAYERGRGDERALWVHKQLEWEMKKSELEAKNAKDVADADARRKKEVDDVRKERDAALADRDRFRLRWRAASVPSGPSPAPGPDPDGACRACTCELPEATREDLIREASRADELAVKYNALLDVARKDREVCR